MAVLLPFLPHCITCMSPHTHTHAHTHQTLEQQTDDPLKKLKEQSKGMVTCRICKGDHWTSKCPYKDTLGPATIKELEEQGIASFPVLLQLQFLIACICGYIPELRTGAREGLGMRLYLHEVWV